MPYSSLSEGWGLSPASLRVLTFQSGAPATHPCTAKGGAPSRFYFILNVITDAHANANRPYYGHTSMMCHPPVANRFRGWRMLHPSSSEEWGLCRRFSSRLAMLRAQVPLKSIHFEFISCGYF